MTLDRRDLIILGTALTLASAVPGSARAAGGELEVQVQEVTNQLRTVLANNGLSEITALPIVTDRPDVNGGLRHDSDLETLSMGQFVVQPCARVNDVDERTRPGVLPLFHECACLQPKGVDWGSNTRMMIRLLTEDFGLNPKRLGFVTVPKGEMMRAVFDEAGIDFNTRVLLRNEADALAARDSSGYFFPDPNLPDHMATIGVYLRLGEAGSPQINSYPPPPDWVEIAEIVIEGSPAPVLSFGVERLTLAVTDQNPNWDDRLARLFKLVEDDSSGLPPPSGIQQFRQE